LMTLEELALKMSVNPRRILNLPGGEISPGQPADLTLVDLERAWTVDPATFLSKSRNTPFAGRQLTGRAVAVFAGGRLIHAAINIHK
ncbi:MAG: amidohydrolase family protein, partial [Bacteroidota bacterium]